MKNIFTDFHKTGRINRIFSVLCICVLFLAGSFGSVVSETIEGPGYASSTEVAHAYADYFSHGDLEGMISTFAVETYADHINMDAYAEDMDYFVSLFSSSVSSLPDESEYLHNLNILKRQMNIIDLFVRQAMVMGYGGDTVGSILTNQEQYESYISAFRNKSWPQSGSQSETAAFSAQELFEQLNMPEKYQEYLEFQKRSYDRDIARYGCDDLDSVVTFISFDGEFYIQFLTSAKYGDKWYLLDASSNALEYFVRLAGNMRYGVYTLLDLAGAADWTIAAISDLLGRR